jgi:F420-non-reducing hydrogenase small subunit
MTKPKVALYWASGCGGCEIAFANLNERILELAAVVDFVFCPCLLDGKRKDVEALADGELALTLFDGAIRTDENADWARLLRRKSKTLVAMGACAYGGGIPALSNLHDPDSTFRRVFLEGTDNPEGVVPSHRTVVPEGVLELPGFHDRVKRLADVVPVEYSIPGCPPEADQLWNVLRLFVSGEELPPAGAVLGAGPASVCSECPRKRTDKKVAAFRRVWEFEPDPDLCLVEQGIACMGLATRGGCGALCPAVQMPCIGCYGPPEGVYDQAAKVVSVLGSVLDIAPIRELRRPEEIAARVDAALDAIPDVAGLAGKFHLARGGSR